MSDTKHLAISVAAVLLLLPVWWLAHLNTNFIADPFLVASRLPDFLRQPDTWYNIGITLYRVVLGLAIGAALGVAAAFAMKHSRLAEEVLTIYVTTALRTPSAVVAILGLAIFKRAEIGYIVVVAFITFPFMAVGLRDGLKSMDRELENVSQIYRLGIMRHLRHVTGPYVAPYMFSALRNAHALAWKVIVVAEIFGAARAGFGARFNNAWYYMEMVEVHLWLLVFIALVLFVEYGVIRVIERRVFRWRT